MQLPSEQPWNGTPSAPASGQGRPPSAHHALLFATRRVSRRQWFVLGSIVAVIIAAVGTVLWFAEIDWAGMTRAVEQLPPVPLVGAMMVLPLIGFPVLPVYLVAGARFGPLGGGGVVLLATAAHLVGTYLIARTILRRPLQRWLRRWHAHLPEIPRDEEAAVTVIAALVPGLPYVVRNYLLAIAGIRLRVYLWICLPIYVARSYVSILLGDLSGAPDRSRLMILGGVELVKGAICALVIWRLRRHHRRLHGGAAPATPSDAAR